MKPARVAPLVQLGLLALLWVRADWALWAFALIVYSTVLMGILESLSGIRGERGASAARTYRTDGPLAWQRRGRKS